MYRCLTLTCHTVYEKSLFYFQENVNTKLSYRIDTINIAICFSESSCRKRITPCSRYALLRSELGFWDTLCREKMPASKFLVQTDPAVFNELVKVSSLPCFTTDYGLSHSLSYDERINLPLTDAEANVTFYLGKRI